MATNKYSSEYVENYFIENNCELLTPYENVKGKLKYRCKCTNVVETNFDAFKRSKYKKCKSCIGKENNMNSTINLDVAKKFYQEQNCELLEDEYINSKTKMKFKCACGAVDYKDWNHFRRGHRCANCISQNRSEAQRTEIQDIVCFLNENGMELLDENFVTGNDPILIKCVCGKEVKKKFNTIKMSPRCTCEYNYVKPLQRFYSHELLVDYFWKFYKENGRYPLHQDIKDNPELPSISTYSRDFGSYTEFLKIIGVLQEDGWFDLEIKTLLEMFDISKVDDLKKMLLKNRSKKSIIEKAIELNVYEHKEKYILSNQELLEYIITFFKTNKRNPTMKDFNKSQSLPNSSIIIKRFGSWLKALEMAGLTVNRAKILTEDDENQIVSLYKEKVPSIDIASMFSVHPVRVLYVINKHNVKKNKNQWTEEQISNLKKYYPNENWDFLLNMFYPFDKNGILTKASSLGVKRECFGWNDEEVKLLVLNYGKIPLKELLKLLPSKTYGALISKSRKLNLKNYSEKWNDEDLDTLKKVYPVLKNKDIQSLHFPNRHLASIGTKANELGLYKGEVYKAISKEQTKKDLLEILQKYSKEIGKTPKSEDFRNNPDLPGMVSYHRYFGSYTQACIEAGLEPNQMMFGKSYSYTSDNGDRCLSSKELLITNLLYKNNIEYEKENLYRDILDDSDLSLIRCDWYLRKENIVIEYFGMPDKDYYYERMLEKISLCETRELPLIALLPEDLNNNLQGLVEKFKEYEIDIKLDNI